MEVLPQSVNIADHATFPAGQIDGYSNLLSYHKQHKH